MKFKYFLIIFLMSALGCVSKSLVEYQAGDLLKNRQNIKSKSLSPSLKVSFSLEKEGSKKFLVAEVWNKQETIEEWEDLYSKVALYEKKCRGWRAEHEVTNVPYCDLPISTFVLYHVVLLGFLYDFSIPFQSYGEVIYVKEPVDGIFVKKEVASLDQRLSVEDSLVELDVNGIRANGVLKGGVVRFEMERLGLTSEFSEIVELAQLHINSKKMDVSYELQSFINSEVEKKIARKEAIRKEKQNPENKYGMKFCQSYDLYNSFFNPYEVHVEKDCMYVLHAPLKVFQSLGAGVLVTEMNPNPQNFDKIIFIKTKKKHVDNTYVGDILVKYTGPFQYQAVMGNTKTIHGFQYVGDIKVKPNPRRGDYSLEPEQGY